MTKVKGYGCKSVLSALCLQFQLAGHGLRCKLRRTEKGQWVVEAQLRDYSRSVPALGRTVTACGTPWDMTPSKGSALGVAQSVSIHGGA